MTAEVEAIERAIEAEGRDDFQEFPWLVDQPVTVAPPNSWSSPLSFSDRADERAARQFAMKLMELFQLPKNWDSYGAEKVDQGNALSAIRTLLPLLRIDTPIPDLVPTPAGTVQAEWHTNGIDLEVDFVSKSRILVSFENHNCGTNGDYELTNDLTVLSELIEALSSENVDCG